MKNQRWVQYSCSICWLHVVCTTRGKNHPGVGIIPTFITDLMLCLFLAPKRHFPLATLVTFILCKWQSVKMLAYYTQTKADICEVSHLFMIWDAQCSVPLHWFPVNLLSGCPAQGQVLYSLPGILLRRCLNTAHTNLPFVSLFQRRFPLFFSSVVVFQIVEQGKNAKSYHYILANLVRIDYLTAPVFIWVCR